MFLCFAGCMGFGFPEGVETPSSVFESGEDDPIYKIRSTWMLIMLIIFPSCMAVSLLYTLLEMVKFVSPLDDSKAISAATALLATHVSSKGEQWKVFSIRGSVSR